MRSLPIVYSLLFATTVAAQAPSRAVRGIVYDSVAGAPLAGAIIQVALTDTARGPSERRLYSGVSDSAGHYMVSGLAPGHYVIGFQHDALLALGIDSPLRAFEVEADGISSIDLATPSPAVLRTVRCGSIDQSRPGMLYGSVTNARNGARPDGGVVTVNWTEVGIKDNKLRSVPFSIRAPVADDGSFLACGLTTDATLSLHVTAMGHRTLDGDIVVPSNGVLHRDITLADTTAVKGTARVAGRVVLADGKPLPSGQAIISALNIDVPVVNGQFSIAGIPAGTWQVDARALGYEPQSALVDVREGAPANVLVRLTERAQVLDAVSVVGRANNAVNKELKILEGINERSRMSAGTVFGPGSEALKNALVTADVIRYARGFRYISPTVVQGRNAVMVADKANTLCVNAQCNRQKQDSSVVGFAFQNEPCSTEIDDDKIASPTARKKRVMIYLDGMIFNGNLEMLNTTIAMSEILAVEAYPDVGNAPPIWRTAEACAIIAVWRKR